MVRTIRFTAVLAAFTILAVPLGAAEHPLSSERRERLRDDLQKTVERLTKSIEADADNVRLYSRRGDAWFFLGRFRKAVADYEKMLELRPQLEAQHWRLGLAYFYTGRYKKAARQFELYHTVGPTDRENGIWRFFAQAKAEGVDKAREDLLQYDEPDREPFPALYELVAGRIGPRQVLEPIRAADIDKQARQKRLYYAHLYIGFHDAIQGKRKPAVAHLRKAVGSEWAPQASYGPHYMWHVGRLHYELLTDTAKDGQDEN